MMGPACASLVVALFQVRRYNLLSPMGWFPHFLSPLSAAIAAAITLPLLLILYFLKLRRREMPVSSTFLWKKSVQDLQVNAPFQRLRRNLLLLLQMLLLLALILALSRPVSNFTPGAGKLSVILIDRSASMSAPDMPNGKTRLEEAKRQATDLVNGMDRGGQATVIAFDDEPEIMQTFTADASALRAAIERIEPTDRRTKLAMAFQLAEAQAAYIPENNRSNVRPEVWLFSDGRASDSKDLRLQADLKYQKIGSDTADNIGIVALDARRDYDQPVSVQVFARLANFGPHPVTADVRLVVDGQDRSIAGVTLAPENDPGFAGTHPDFGAKDSVEFRIDMPAAGTIKVEQLNRANDMLAADDSAEVVVPPPKALSVLLVTREHDNPYLEKAFASMGLKDSQVMLEDDYEEKQPKNFDVIIFDRVYPSWLPESGNYMYFGCAPTNGKLHVVKDGDVYQTIDDCSVLDWQRDNPILRHLQLGNLYAGSMLKLDMPGDAKVLIEGLKGPMLVLDREGRNTNLVCAFDVLQSNWPLKLSFPIFIHSALQYLALGADMNIRPSFEPGATPRIPRTNLDKLGPGVRSIQLNGPMGSRSIPIPSNGDFVLPALNKVGLYKTEPPVPQFEQIAVNLLDANESNLLPANAPPGNVGVAMASGTGKSRLELWWWLVACGAVPLLLIEWWVYTRRVHL
jgi:hypothetical protein